MTGSTPAGFAFENYDSMGRWRETDNDQDVALELADVVLNFRDGVDLSRQPLPNRYATAMPSAGPTMQWGSPLMLPTLRCSEL